MSLFDRKPMNIAVASVLVMLGELAFAPLELRRVLATGLVTAVTLGMAAWGLERFAWHRFSLVRAGVIVFVVFAPFVLRVAFGKLGFEWNTYLIPIGLGLVWLYRAIKPNELRLRVKG